MPFIFTIQNVPQADDVVNVSLTDGDGVNRVYEYEVVAGNTLADICNALLALINADIYFTAITQTTYSGDGLEISQVTTNNYNLFTGSVTIEYNPATVSPAYTMAFDENNNAFEGERSYHPEWMVCLGVLVVTFKNGSPYSHDGSTFNNFYGVQYPSSITGVANKGLYQKKTWISLVEIASTVWTCPQIYTSLMTYGQQRQESSLVLQNFRLLESQPSSSFRRDQNSPGGLINGWPLKGSYIAIKFEVDATRSQDLVALSGISVKYIDSPLTVTN